MITRLLALVAGLALVVYGLQGPLLSVAGTAATGYVVDVERRAGSDQMDYEYSIRYRFTVAGKEYTGVDSMTRVYDSTRLPDTGSPIAVRYLTAYPAINAPARTAGFNLGRLGAMALGILVIVAGRKGNRLRPAA